MWPYDSIETIETIETRQMKAREPDNRKQRVREVDDWNESIQMVVLKLWS